jgi:hypothetical protein
MDTMAYKAPRARSQRDGELVVLASFPYAAFDGPCDGHIIIAIASIEQRRDVELQCPNGFRLCWWLGVCGQRQGSNPVAHMEAGHDSGL